MNSNQIKNSQKIRDNDQIIEDDDDYQLDPNEVIDNGEMYQDKNGIHYYNSDCSDKEINLKQEDKLQNIHPMIKDDLTYDLISENAT